MTKILVVDDDESICANLKEILEKYGYSVKTVFTGEHAIREIEREHYDVVLVDLLLPGMDGIHVLMDIKRISPKTIVIIITAFGTISNAVEAIKRGASNYVTKPFRIEELITVIKKAMEEEKIEKLDVNALFCLSHKLRREILLLLMKKRKMKFSELVRDLKIDDPPKLSFHLKILKNNELISQNENKEYYITYKGINLLNLTASDTQQNFNYKADS